MILKKKIHVPTVPDIRFEQGHLTDVINSSIASNQHVLLDLLERGESTQPIHQHDIDRSAASTKLIARQRIGEYRHQAESLTHELEGFRQRLSQPLDFSDTEIRQSSPIHVSSSESQHPVRRTITALKGGKA